MKAKVLPLSFFHRPVLEVAPDLLGKFLVCGERVGMITEVEAYDGPEDLACHASKGRTARTEVMFGPAGRWYIYLVYGMHWMLNIVTGDKDYPAAVLIRGVSGVAGPGKLTKFFGIDKRSNGRPASKASGLYLEDRGVAVPRSKIIQTPRIGIDYAGPIWKEKPWRFLLDK